MRGNLSREEETHVERKPRVQPLLEHDKTIIFQITEIHFSSDFYNIGMLLDEQPSNVSEEETSRGIVRVRIGFRKFVVYTVVSRPMINASLIRNGIEQH